MNVGGTRRLIESLVCISLFAFTITALAEHLRWDNPNKPGEIQSYTVFATGPLPSANVRKMTVTTNEIDIAALMALAPQGRYVLSVVSNGTNKLSSARSRPLMITWGVPALKAATKLACDNVLFSRENKGVVYQTLQDKVHSFAATAFKAENDGHVCKVGVNLRKFHEPAGELTFHVWSNYKGKPAALLATSPIGIDTAQIKDGWCEADLKFAPLAGETYWVGFSSSTVSPSNNLLWLGGGSGARCYSADGITWVSASSEAMNIRLYGE